MRFNPKARLDTSRVRDAGGGGGGRGGGVGGGQMRLPIPGGAKAGGGIGGLLIILLIFVVSQCSGVDITGGGGPSPTSDTAIDTSRVAGDAGRYTGCRTGADANDDIDCARIAVENSLFDYWTDTLPAQSDTGFQPATMLTFTGAVNTGCGQATSQVGPFYCPPDSSIYLDTTFFDDVLERQLGGPDGGFVEPYVLAHEYGHHIQNLLGTMGQVRTQQGPRSDAVRLELQADCYAGMWAASATQSQDSTGTALFTSLTDEDISQAIAAAEAVGDDRIQQKTQGQVTEESWTHGSAASRAEWFKTGFDNGTLESCDTFAVATP
ncbi:MAG: neutral zinc metallopeptidase [Nocardioides sp.]